jgi:hypothetical protein
VKGLAAAKDLTAEAPRGLDAELEGYAWLPRMLDKARATLAGTAGSYLFGCPVDHTCMARLGIAPELVLDLAARHTDDHAVLDALRAHGILPAAGAWFDGEAVENELQETGNYLRVRAREPLPEAEGGRVFAGAEHGAAVSVVLVDARPARSRGRTCTRSRRSPSCRTARRPSSSAHSRRASCGPAGSSGSPPAFRTAASPRATAGCARSPCTAPPRW